MMLKRVCLLAVGLATAGCASTSNDRLRAEIAALESDISGIEADIESHTAPAGALTKSIHSRVAYRPLKAWIANFNNRPAGERMIGFRQTGRDGYLARKKFSCPIGRGGWYVEFDSSEATRGEVLIEALSLNTATGSITAATPLSFNLRSQLHWHFDPCIGGGAGGSVGLSARERVQTALNMGFGQVQEGSLPYVLDLTSPNQIKITVQVHLGKIGTLGIPFEIDNIARRITEGKINLLFDNSGTLGPVNGQTYTYRVQTNDPQVATTAEAIEFGSDVVITVEPAVS